MSLGKVDIDTFLPPGVSQLDLDAAELLDFSSGTPDPQIVQALIRNGALQDLPDETLQMLGGGAITKKQLRQLATLRALIDNGTISPEGAQTLVAAAMARDAARANGQGSASGNANKRPSTTTARPATSEQPVAETPMESLRMGRLTQEQMEQIVAIMSGGTPAPPVAASPVTPAPASSVTPNQIAALMANPNAVAALQNNPAALAALMANPAAMAELTNRPSAVAVPFVPVAPAPVVGGISPAMMMLILTNPAMMAAFQANPAAFATVPVAAPMLNHLGTVHNAQVVPSQAQGAALQAAGITPAQFAAFQAAGGTSGASPQPQTPQVQNPPYFDAQGRLVTGLAPGVQPVQTPLFPNGQVNAFGSGVNQGQFPGQVPSLSPGFIPDQVPSNIPIQFPGQQAPRQPQVAVQLPITPPPVQAPTSPRPVQLPVPPVAAVPLPRPPPQAPIPTPAPAPLTTTVRIPGLPPGATLPPGLPASVAAQLPEDFDPSDFEGLPPDIIKQAFPELVAQLTDEEIRLLTSQANSNLGIRRKKDISQEELNYVKLKMEDFIKRRADYESWLLSHIPAKDRPIGSSVLPKKIPRPPQPPVRRARPTPNPLHHGHPILSQRRPPAPPPRSTFTPVGTHFENSKRVSTNKPKRTTTDFMRLSRKTPRPKRDKLQTSASSYHSQTKPVPVQYGVKNPNAKAHFTPSIKITERNDAFTVISSGSHTKAGIHVGGTTTVAPVKVKTILETSEFHDEVNTKLGSSFDGQKKKKFKEVTPQQHGKTSETNRAEAKKPAKSTSSENWGVKLEPKGTGKKRNLTRLIKQRKIPTAAPIEKTVSTTKRPRAINYYLSQQSKKPTESTTNRNYEKITTPIQPLKTWASSKNDSSVVRKDSSTISRPKVKFRKIVSDPKEALKFFRGDVFGPFPEETIVSEESLKNYEGDIIDLDEISEARRILSPFSSSLARSVRSTTPGHRDYEEVNGGNTTPYTTGYKRRSTAGETREYLGNDLHAGGSRKKRPQRNKSASVERRFTRPIKPDYGEVGVENTTPYTTEDNFASTTGTISENVTHSGESVGSAANSKKAKTVVEAKVTTKSAIQDSASLYKGLEASKVSSSNSKVSFSVPEMTSEPVMKALEVELQRTKSALEVRRQRRRKHRKKGRGKGGGGRTRRRRKMSSAGARPKILPESKDSSVLGDKVAVGDNTSSSSDLNNKEESTENR